MSHGGTLDSPVTTVTTYEATKATKAPSDDPDRFDLTLTVSTALRSSLVRAPALSFISSTIVRTALRSSLMRSRGMEFTVALLRVRMQVDKVAGTATIARTDDIEFLDRDPGRPDGFTEEDIAAFYGRPRATRGDPTWENQQEWLNPGSDDPCHIAEKLQAGASAPARAIKDIQAESKAAQMQDDLHCGI